MDSEFHISSDQGTIECDDILEWVEGIEPVKRSPLNERLNDMIVPPAVVKNTLTKECGGRWKFNEGENGWNLECGPIQVSRKDGKYLAIAIIDNRVYRAVTENVVDSVRGCFARIIAHRNELSTVTDSIHEEKRWKDTSHLPKGEFIGWGWSPDWRKPYVCRWLDGRCTKKMDNGLIWLHDPTHFCKLNEYDS